MPIIIGLICLFPLLIGGKSQRRRDKPDSSNRESADSPASEKAVASDSNGLWNCRDDTGGGCTLAYMDVGRSIAADADSFYSNAAGSFLFCGAVSGAQTI